MTYELPVQAIDYLLYNYVYLRKEVELLGAQQSGVVKIPPRGTRRGSPVEVIAIERAELTMVLDAVDRAWQSLTPELRQIARAKYRRGMKNIEIQKRYYLSKSTLDRKLGCIRATVAGYLALVPEAILRRFWGENEARFEELVRRR